jgi:hypothetical protein
MLKLAKIIKKMACAYLALTLFLNTTQPTIVLAQKAPQPETPAPEPISEPVVAVEKVLTVQEVLFKVCQERGYGEECAKHLLGMMWKESNNKAKAIGDKGKARGYFQIHYKLHKIPVACAEDLECSANWTIDYLEKNHYPKYVTYAVQCHNGCDIDNGYAASALRHGKRLWKQPLPVNPEPEFKIATIKK